ncbi:Hypothetical protein CINCED_3A008306 [Cinara cedri]|uniref:Uncharacterized protein n=1 Tax=Cinara cedri TaxID=506608 RepID=A0A5E4MFE3_9HEMI|nr:Hypothetical protein CINCED_3A008306 [Cinara cedri]
MRNKKPGYFGHAKMRQESEANKNCDENNGGEKSWREGPKKRWLDAIENDMSTAYACEADLRDQVKRKFGTSVADPKSLG